MTFDLTETLRPWRKGYFAEIRSLVEECSKVPEEAREEWLHETIDGHEFVIYTYQARAVMLATDNPSAYEEEKGEAPKGPKQAAYMAMMADVQDRLP